MILKSPRFDEILGPRETRYFGSGYRGVRQEVSDLSLGYDSSGKLTLKANAKVVPSDKAAFDGYFLPVSTEETVTVTPLDAAASHSVRSGAVATTYSSTEAVSKAMAATASGCWGNYVKITAHAAFGNAIWDTYTEGTWCNSGSSVTSASFSRSWSTIAAAGWRDGGQLGAGSGVVSNRAKIWSQHKMILGVGGWDVQTQEPCNRMIGTASGGTSADTVCSIY